MTKTNLVIGSGGVLALAGLSLVFGSWVIVGLFVLVTLIGSRAKRG